MESIEKNIFDEKNNNPNEKKKERPIVRLCSAAGQTTREAKGWPILRRFRWHCHCKTQAVAQAFRA